MKTERKKLRAGLSIYRQTGSTVWYADASMKGRPRARVTLETTDKKEAEQIAFAKYDNALANNSLLPYFGTDAKRLESLFSSTIDYINTSAAIKNKGEPIRFINNYLMQHAIRLKKCSAITEQDVANIIVEAESKTRFTLRKQAWKYILKVGKLENAIINDIDLSEIKKEFPEDDRDPIDQEDLKLLVAGFRGFVKKGRTSTARDNRLLLGYYLKFIYCTGLRAGDEIQLLEWKDLKANDELLVRYGKIQKRKGKPRTVILNKKAEQTLTKLAKMQRIDLARKRHNSSCIFSRNNQRVDFTKIFNQLLEFCSIPKKETGYVPYSLRHNYITRLIMKNVNVVHIAMQCGTSVDIIMRYYNDVRTESIKEALKV